MFISVMISDG